MSPRLSTAACSAPSTIAAASAWIREQMAVEIGRDADVRVSQPFAARTKGKAWHRGSMLACFEARASVASALPPLVATVNLTRPR